MKMNMNKMIEACKTVQRAQLHYEWYRDRRRSTEDEITEAAQELEAAKESFEKTAEQLTAEIKKAEGRATARTITAENLVETLIEIENRLGITKKSMEGIRVVVDYNAQTFPSAYKYRPESTFFVAVYNKGWKLTDIRRDWTRSPKQAVQIEHTEDSKKAIIDRMTHFEI